MFAVPAVDFAAENLSKKVQELGKQAGYTRYDPKRDPRFDNNKNMVRIMRWLGSQDK